MGRSTRPLASSSAARFSQTLAQKLVIGIARPGRAPLHAAVYFTEIQPPGGRAQRDPQASWSPAGLKRRRGAVTGGRWPIKKGATGSLLSKSGFPTRYWPKPAPTSVTSKLVRMVASICSVTSPPRLRGSMISRRAAAPLRSLMRGGSAIWVASRKVSHSPHRVVRSSGSTRASRAEISSCWSPRLPSCPGEGADLPFQGDRLSRASAVLQGVPVAPRSPASCPVHPADAMCPRTAGAWHWTTRLRSHNSQPW